MHWELCFSSAGFSLWAGKERRKMKKISKEQAKQIFEVIGYTITMCSYGTTGQEPDCEDVNELTRIIFCDYLENVKGITEIEN